MRLTQPLFLALVLPAALLVWWGLRRSLAAWTPRQRGAVATLRTLWLTCLILALAGLQLRRESDALNVLFLVDASPSVAPPAATAARTWVEAALRARRGPDRAAVAGFADQVRIWQPFVATSELVPQWPGWPPDAPPATEIGRALDFAQAVLPAQGLSRVVLLSDGHDTGGRAREAAAALRAAGHELLTVPLRNPEQPEVLVGEVVAPRSVRQGQPFDVRLGIEANVATNARVNLYQDGLLLGGRETALRPGRNEIVFPNQSAGGGFANFEAEVIAERDTRVENNRLRFSVASAGEPRVLLVEGDAPRARPLAEALRQGRIAVEVRGPAGAPRRLEELQAFDLFILSDVSALQLGRDQMELYRTWVQDYGGGFVMLGGENSFGVGGYYRTPVEQMLPVRMEHDDRQDTPTVALLVTLDRSGSMSATVQGQTKMSLANQGAALALGVLQTKDQFCLTAVDTKINLVAPLARVGSRQAIEQKILSITAGGGGIYIYTALLDAFQRLRDANAKIKHVILFSDAADAEEKFSGEMTDGVQGGGTAQDLVSQMLQARITTSVVALGFERDKDVPFLRLLAERGNGRFYLTNDALNLPQIFTTETMKVAQSSLLEDPFQARVTGRSAALAGLDWSAAPLLLGCNATKLKPTAEQQLATETGEPLLATWRYGLGQTAAFTSDAKSRWAVEWLGWNGYGKFWSQLVRSLLRPADPALTQLRTEEKNGRLEIEFDAVQPDGAFANGLVVTATATSPDGRVDSRTAAQVAPGRYRTDFPLPVSNEGVTLFAVSAPGALERPQVFSWTPRFPAEFLQSGTNEQALRDLAQVAGGSYDPAPTAVFAPPGRSVAQWLDLANALLMAALLLLPLDIYLRRREWR